MPSSGKMSESSSSAGSLLTLVGWDNTDLPTCTSLEMVEIVIKDRTGLPFAKLDRWPATAR